MLGRIWVLAATLVLAVLLLLLIVEWQPLLVHLSQETGTSNSASRAYDFWSGFGSDLGEIAIVGGLISICRRHNCHTKSCWRIGRHQVAGTTYIVCRRHHPDGKPTHHHILAAHRAHLERTAASRKESQ